MFFINFRNNQLMHLQFVRCRCKSQSPVETPNPQWAHPGSRTPCPHNNNNILLIIKTEAHLIQQQHQHWLCLIMLLIMIVLGNWALSLVLAVCQVQGAFSQMYLMILRDVLCCSIIHSFISYISTGLHLSEITTCSLLSIEKYLNYFW